MIKAFEKIKIFLNTDAGESVVAVFTGGVPAAIVGFSIEQTVVKIIMTAIVGLVGGATALLGKDLYKWAKKKLFK